MPGPLCHIRVLDLSRVLAGPWASQNLADLGAEIIKVERPGRGDDTRAWGPPYLKDAKGRDTDQSAYYLACNRSKKSITLDIATPAAQDIVRRLAAESDVVVENFKVGGLAKFGLGYDHLRAVNPALVYCSITGFGQSGPYRDRPGYDYVIQGMAGLMSITGESDRRPGGGPMRVGVAIADIMTGMYATIAILAAITHRDRCGEGQHIDMALFDTLTGVLANQAMNYLLSGTPPGRVGNTHPNVVPYQVFAAADGDLIIAVGNDRQFAKFCGFIGRPALAGDPRFATNAARVTNRDALLALLAPPIKRRTRNHWLAALEAEGIPCGPINGIDQVFNDPQIVARGMKVEVPHPEAGTVPLVTGPMRFSATTLDAPTAPPTLGQHTDAVLRDLLGMDAAAIADLRKQGVV